jgi:hypothetical protein
MPKYHVQVLETDADDSFAPARELLPWADPYIASLMGRLEQHEHGHDDETWDYEPLDDEADEEEEVLRDELPEDDDWHLDREPRFPPVYGGWPLLNDA